eukprot:tig00020614_g12235.t1
MDRPRTSVWKGPLTVIGPNPSFIPDIPELETEADKKAKEAKGGKGKGKGKGGKVKKVSPTKEIKIEITGHCSIMYLIQLIEREFELKQPQQIMLFEGRRLWIELGSIKCISDFGIGPGATIRVLKGVAAYEPAAFLRSRPWTAP